MNELQHRGLNEKVYQLLKDMIINGELSPGIRLQEDFLVEKIGTSKTPIKMALAKLENEGLILRVPRRGTYVTEINQEAARNVYLVREMLEALAARLSASNLTEEEMGYLRNLLLKMEDKLEQNKYRDFVTLDEEFHKIIIASAKHDLLSKILSDLFNIIKMFKLRSASLSGRTRKAFQEHKKLLSALERRDPNDSENAMREHIQKVMKDVFDNLKPEIR